jgi:hypothetical protein
VGTCSAVDARCIPSFQIVTVQNGSRWAFNGYGNWNLQMSKRLSKRGGSKCQSDCMSVQWSQEALGLVVISKDISMMIIEVGCGFCFLIFGSLIHVPA